MSLFQSWFTSRYRVMNWIKRSWCCIQTQIPPCLKAPEKQPAFCTSEWTLNNCPTIKSLRNCVKLVYSVSYLLVRKPRHCVDILLLDHEGGQVGSVGSQEDDSKKGPDQDHDLTRCSFWVFNGDRVVEDDAPQEPHWLSNGERWTTGGWGNEGRVRSFVLFFYNLCLCSHH